VRDQRIWRVLRVVVKHVGVEVSTAEVQLLVHGTLVTSGGHHGIRSHPILRDRAERGEVLCIEVQLTFFVEAGATVAVPELVILVFSHRVTDWQVIRDHVRAIVLAPALHSGDLPTRCLHFASHGQGHFPVDGR